jgi:ABC-type iron transport system FetAB ATPase subunit
MTVIEARELQRLNLGRISLKVCDGECISIMGRSGTGKSILLRMIADLDPHQGDALLDGVPCSSMVASKWRGLVTYVAADSGWWADTVADHFALDTLAKDLLPSLGFPANAFDWPVARLSTGERQRLALLRALQPSTRVLLLDEPTSGLDATSVGMVEALLRDRLAGGISVLLVTHDGEQAKRMAKRHFEVDDGRLVEQRL